VPRAISTSGLPGTGVPCADEPIAGCLVQFLVLDQRRSATVAMSGMPTAHERDLCLKIRAEYGFSDIKLRRETNRVEKSA
jgi:hypothetical protein